MGRAVNGQPIAASQPRRAASTAVPRSAPTPRVLCPSSPLESEITGADVVTACNHMGISSAAVLLRNYDMLRLGELRFITRRLRSPSVEVTPAESIARETVDSGSLGLEARSTTAWEASVLLAEYLREHGRPILTGRRVLELGSGTGLVGLSAAQVAAGQADMTISDSCDTAVSMLHTNRALNSAWLGADVMRALHVCTLRWDAQQQAEREEDEEAARSIFGPWNTALGAGLLRSTEAAETLARFLPSLVLTPSQQGRAGPVVVQGQEQQQQDPQQQGTSTQPSSSPTAQAGASGPTPLILLAHEVRHTCRTGNGSPYDAELSTFLRNVITSNVLPPGRRWDIVVQELSKVSDTPLNITPLRAPAPSPFLSGLPSAGEDVGSLPMLPPSQGQEPPGTRSTRGDQGRDQQGRSGPPGASPPRPGSGLTKAPVPRTESGCNLAAEAFVRAVPLASAGPEASDSVNRDGPRSLLADALQQAKVAAKQPAGAVLLITLMYV